MMPDMTDMTDKALYAAFVRKLDADIERLRGSTLPEGDDNTATSVRLGVLLALRDVLKAAEELVL